MVAAIASQTLRNTDIATASATFNERLRALANAHDILNKTRWTSASIREVVDNTIATFPLEQISISGPALPINPKMALTLALAVNELATNALKYGALSTGEGKVSIEWSLQPSAEAPGEKRCLCWRERWLACDAAQPAAGRFLIERVLGTDFGGSRIDYHPDGVECKATHRRLIADRTLSPQACHQSLATVLVVEDEAFRLFAIADESCARRDTMLRPARRPAIRPLSRPDIAICSLTSTCRVDGWPAPAAAVRELAAGQDHHHLAPAADAMPSGGVFLPKPHARRQP